ncbi:MAG: phosphatidylserine/phosphatidylglycerophosphate/cardiolipin synthase [Candidatus Doudnabacteria bacterium]|nr:phosphatidylserine/phosphatidylglycerophosphate/cardiolipin synthase [Candidatus Doudnabacteria bacterium]
MNTKLFLTLSLICGLVFYDDFNQRQITANNQYAQTSVYYSQTSHSDEQIVKTIQAAHSYVYFAIYTLTKQNIVDALIAAKLRGVDVKGLVDFNQSTIPQEKPYVAKLKKYGISLKIPLKPSGLMHIKMLVTDNTYASGSFNWTTSATSYNDEVLEIGSVKGIHDQYLKIWRTLDAKY